MIKNNILKFAAIVFTAGVVLTSCEKDDDNGSDKVSKLKYNWKITHITTPKVGQPATDSSVFKACMNDDIIQFSNTGFDFKDGATVCDSTIFKYSKGSWAYKLSTDSIQLSATSPAAKYTSWKVVTLNDSILQVKYTDSTNPANKISKTISFKH
ncbi:MAG: lipocalin family protein [Rhizobacter sp.]|nr:lipocalin family protein [Ferruginibacter sp.]